MSLPFLILFLSLCLFSLSARAGDTVTIKPPTTTVPPKLYPTPKLPPLAKGTPQHYRAVVLPKGYEWKALNNKGLVVGGYSQAATWQDGRLTILPKVQSGEVNYHTSADAVADDGTVLGTYHIRYETSHPRHLLMWRNKVVKYIEEPKGYDFSSAIAMNNRHQAVCGSVSDDFHWSYTRYEELLLSDGKYYLLKALLAVTINDLGQIVASPEHEGKVSERIVLWQEGHKRDLGRGTPTHMNNREQIVGTQKPLLPEPTFTSMRQIEEWNKASYSSNINRKPFLITKGRMALLSIPEWLTGAEASHINNREQIVGFGILGSRVTPNLPVVALLWQNNHCYPLQTRTSGLGKWKLTAALDINDRGEILCVARQDPWDNGVGETRYFLLRPK